MPITELSINLIGYCERGSVEILGRLELSGKAFQRTIDKDPLFFQGGFMIPFEDPSAGGKQIPQTVGIFPN